MRALSTIDGFLLAAVLIPVSARAAEEVKASHILVRTQDEADLIRNEIIEKGGDRKAFMEGARKHSKDVTTKRAGGALGWFTRGKMVREFSETAFNLKDGEVSQPVQTEHGWHLIFLEGRRDLQGGQTIPTKDPPPTTPAPKDDHDHDDHAHAHPQPAPAKTPAPGPADLAPPGTPKSPATATPTTPEPQAVKVQPMKPRLQPKALRLTIDIKGREDVHQPSRTVEIELTLLNNGEEAQKVLAPDLWPLGFSVAGEVAPLAPPATWDEVKAKKPETPILSLASRRAVGASFTLNDYFKDLPPNGRYRLGWRPLDLFRNLEQVFPDIAQLPDYASVKAAFTDVKNLSREVAGEPTRLQFRNRDREATFAVFEPVSAAKKYYAGIELEHPPGTIWVELFADRQPEGVKQFAELAHKGFYDWLALFDVKKGDYIRGGCPRDNGTGGPERMVSAQNVHKVPHEKGTLSLVARPNRFGGKEVGSIFFLCRKPHPEWDEEHLPIGKISSGEDLLDRVEANPGRVYVKKVNVVTADKLPGDLAQVAASPLPAVSPPGTPPPPSPAARALPVVKIKTAKGEMTVELFEEDAPNTVANFIQLVEKGFFNPKPEEKKEMAIYAAVPETALITGSPTNDDLGGPGYRIPSEIGDNKRTHEKGTLTMLLQTDPASGNPVPDTAGSQFMMCLKDVPAWNGMYIPFGKVTAGLEVLEKLSQGDKIESVTITSKRNRPYQARTMPLR